MLLQHKTQDKIVINNQKIFKNSRKEANQPSIQNARCAASIRASLKPLHYFTKWLADLHEVLRLGVPTHPGGERCNQNPGRQKQEVPQASKDAKKKRHEKKPEADKEVEKLSAVQLQQSRFRLYRMYVCAPAHTWNNTTLSQSHMYTRTCRRGWQPHIISKRFQPNSISDCKKYVCPMHTITQVTLFCVTTGRSPPESTIEADLPEQEQEVHPDIPFTYAQPDPQTPISASQVLPV